MHNFEQCKIPVRTEINVDLFEQLLIDEDYHDLRVVELLRYGFPIDAREVVESDEVPANHYSVHQYARGVADVYKREIAGGSMVGPFEAMPFPGTRVSPLKAIKKDSGAIRLILNLSHPFHEGSVNHAIDKDSYLGDDSKLEYPSLDSFLEILRDNGPGSLSFKRDLANFYRQIFIDPGDIHLLGHAFDGKLWFDTTLSMGLRSACRIAQRVTDAVMFLFTQLGYQGRNYLDDLAGNDVPDRASGAYRALGSLLETLNLKENVKKREPPHTIMSFVGINTNTEDMTVSITPQRLMEIRQLVRQARCQTLTDVKQVRSVIGKLAFAAKTCPPGRIFYSRLITFLKQMPLDAMVPWSEDAARDLFWWEKYLEEFDGVAVIPDAWWSTPDAVISTDACLRAAGGYCALQRTCFHAVFPQAWTSREDVSISELECFAVILALRVWGEILTGRRLVLKCDNEATVHVVNSGRARNQFTQACLREILFWCAKWQLQIFVQHVSGESNRVADLCSRLHEDELNWERVQEVTSKDVLQVPIPDDFFNFCHSW